MTDQAGDDTLNARHNDKMRKLKAARDRMMEKKTIEKGLLIVHTGNGKGKTSAALGMVFRHIGHDMPVGIVQFTKSAKWDTGEARLLNKFPDLVTLHIMGEGFTWETQDIKRDVAAAQAAWAKALELIGDPSIGLVVLDELNIALRYDYLDLDDVVAALKGRRQDLHVVVTGRNAKPALIEAADLVTEMGAVKHHFTAGVKAQKGIEF